MLIKPEVMSELIPFLLPPPPHAELPQDWPQPPGEAPPPSALPGPPVLVGALCAVGALLLLGNGALAAALLRRNRNRKRGAGADERGRSPEGRGEQSVEVRMGGCGDNGELWR